MVHQGAGDRCSTREGDPTQEWVGHWLAGGEQLLVMQHLFCMHYFYYHHYYYLFLFCPSKLSLFQPAFFLIVSPIPLEGRVNKQLCGA